MSKSTISTFELFQMFPDQESARAYFEARRWPDGATCPACGEAGGGVEQDSEGEQCAPAREEVCHVGI